MEGHGARRAARGQLDRSGAGQVRVDLSDRSHRIGEREVFDLEPVFDGVDEKLGHADLQRRRRLRDVRVADDDVHAPVRTRVGQGLVARVDDGARAGGGRGHGVPHLVGALGELEARRRGGGVDPPVPHQDLACHEEGDERVGDLAEVAPPMQQVVFVTAIRVALRVQVVAEQVQRQVGAQLRQRLVGLDGQVGEHDGARAVLLQEILESVTLGGGVLGVGAHVQVEAPAVTQEKVGGTALVQEGLEQLASGVLGVHRRRPGRGRGRQPVLRFDAENSAPHVTGRPSGRSPARRPRHSSRGRSRSRRGGSQSRRYGPGPDPPPRWRRRRAWGRRQKSGSTWCVLLSVVKSAGGRVEGVGERESHQVALARVENERRPRGLDQVRAVAHGPSAHVGARVGRCLVGGPFDFLVGHEAVHHAGLGEAEHEAVAGSQVRPLHVDGGQARVVPLQSRAFLLALDELVLADPLDLGCHRKEVGAHAVEDGLPQREDLLVRRRRRGSGLLEGVQDEVEVDLLEFGGRVGAAGRADLVVEVRVVGDVPRLLHGIVHDDGVPAQVGALLDGPQDQGGRAETQEGGHVEHVAVSADHVQAAELCGVGVGLVARVDDRTVEGRLESDLVFDEVRALRHLEAGDLALLPASDAARATDDGAGDHEGGQAAHDRVQVGDAWHLVVLVGAVGRALAVGVVFDENDGLFAQCLQALQFLPPSLRRTSHGK